MKKEIIFIVFICSLNMFISCSNNENETNSKIEEIDYSSMTPEEISPLEEIQLSETNYGFLRKPVGEGPFPTFLVIHGTGNQFSKEDMRERALGKAFLMPMILLEKGYAVMFMTRRAATDGPQSMGYIQDTNDMIQHLIDRPDIELSALVGMGQSVGGHVILQAAEEFDFPAFALDEPGTIIYQNMMSHDYMASIGVPVSNIPAAFNAMLQTAETEGVQFFNTQEVHAFTQQELAKITSPILMIHGDVHGLYPFNTDIFIPAVEESGLTIEFELYPGEIHGFGWGRGQYANPDTPWNVADRLDNFFRNYISIAPKSTDGVTCIQYSKYHN